MKKVYYVVLIGVLVLAAFVTGAWISWRASGAGHTHDASEVLYYNCPMHPLYRSDKMGDCPSCGMRLVPVRREEASGGTAGVPGAFKVPDDKQQLIGVRLGVVENGPVERVMRTVGRVAADENRLYRLVAPSDGVVRRLFGHATGSSIGKNDLLLSFLSRETEFQRAQQAYLYALDVVNGAVKSGTPEEQARLTLQAATDTLARYGVGETQMAALAKSRRTSSEIEVRSPVDGYVLSRSISPGQRFDGGEELFTIADLARVWILADVYENESQGLRPGARVKIAGRYGKGDIEARVSQALPQFDPDSRTMKIRLEADNRDYSLRPGMFVDLDLPVSFAASAVVPADAVVDSGTRKTVYVDRGNGYFEPRRVETGWRLDDRVEIRKGLRPGERIVLSGTFMLDSESRMKAAASGIVTAGRDPVCGMDVDEGTARKAGLVATYKGETHFFCSEDCKKKFQANPAAFIVP